MHFAVYLVINKDNVLDSYEIISFAIRKSAVRHSSRPEVVAMLGNIDRYADDVLRSVSDGSYAGRLSYSTFFVTNSNGKRRRIERPSLYTRVLQHLSIRLLEPSYRRLDPEIAYNCKEGYGITASDSRKSLIHFLKHNVYERRDLHYALAIDQRKCYEHMTRKLYRKALKMLAVDTELVDFAINVAFNGNSLPIGTPTSPFVHHVIMLAFDRWLGSVPGPKARYADDTLILFRTREEANRAAWRIRNFWWYTYGILAKRNPQIIDIDKSPLSFCGTVLHRNPGKSRNSHGKGYCRPRRNIRERARKCRTDESYSSYFGLFSKTDSFKFLSNMEAKMDFKELTRKIKIKRDFDAEPISLPELAKSTFSIYDFELRFAKDRDGNQVPNWLRMLVGIPESDTSGNPTGKWLRYCCKTEATALVQYMYMVKELIDSGEPVMPLNNVEIENSCGYMFKGSTNREMYCSRDNISLPNSSVRK